MLINQTKLGQIVWFKLSARHILLPYYIPIQEKAINLRKLKLLSNTKQLMLVNQTTLPNGMLLKLLARLHILSYKIQIQENDWN